MGRRKTCMCGLTGVSTLVKLRVRDFTVGQTTLKAASSKMAKHEKACFDIQHAFIPFAFDIFGFLTAKVVDLLQRVMHNNVISPRSINIVRLPSI
jgi:hypothetical protein